MDWVRVDVDFFDHPKILGLPERAQILYLRGLLYCGKHETDWVVPTAFCARSKAKPLVDAGVWDVVDGGWHIHNAEERQPGIEQLRASRERRSEHARKAARARWEHAPSIASSNASSMPNGCSDDATLTVTHTSSSSASHLREVIHTPDDDDLVGKALNILADRRMKLANGSIANPGAYRQATLRGLREQYADQLYDLALVGDAQQVADFLEPPPPPVRTDFAPGTGRIPNWSKGES